MSSARRFGDVQVRLIESAGKITDVQALQCDSIAAARTRSASTPSRSCGARRFRRRAPRSTPSRAHLHRATRTTAHSSPRSTAPVGAVAARTWHRATPAGGVAASASSASWARRSASTCAAAIPRAAVDAAFDHLRDVDARFSPFIEGSEISRLGRGEIALENCSTTSAAVYRRSSSAACSAMASSTSAAIERMAGSIVGLCQGLGGRGRRGCSSMQPARRATANAGDVIARGEPEPGRKWRIRHDPELADRVAAVIEARDAAVATSGI